VVRGSHWFFFLRAAWLYARRVAFCLPHGSGAAGFYILRVTDASTSSSAWVTVGTVYRDCYIKCW